MLHYYHEIITNDIVYSVDMVRYDFTVSESNLQKITNFLNSPSRIDVESFGLSTSPFKYRYLYKINYRFSSMVVGLGFNGITKLDSLKCFVEFNPNKVFQDKDAMDDVIFLSDYSRRFKLKRYDIAIDIPLARNLVQLVKDQRKYQLVMKSNDDKSEYLGVRNSGGFVKLYNKTKESKLNCDLTRLEITCDADMCIDDIMREIPQLLFSPVQERLTLDNSLSDKDRLLVDLLKLHPDMFARLNYRNRIKLKPYVFSGGADILLDRDSIIQCSKWLLNFTK